MTDLGSSPRVAEAYKELVRYIYSHGLGRGDKLPSQEELRQTLGYSHHTLSRAMGLLTDAGVVSRKPKVGTIVQDAESTVEGIWAIGLLPQAADGLNVPFFAYLAYFLQTQLVQRGCRVHLFPNVKAEGSKPEGHFPGLEEEIEAKSVDGIVSTVHLHPGEARHIREYGLPLLHVGPDISAENGICINQKSMVVRATEQFLEKGCRRIAVVSNYGNNSGQARFWQGMEEVLKSWPDSQAKGESLAEGDGPDAGARVAAHLIGERSEEDRPDAIIVLDDRIAMGLTTELSRSNGYQPQIAVQTNLQVPLSFPVPVHRFSVDIETMANLGANKMMRQLRDPTEPRGVTWVEPQIVGEKDGEAMIHTGIPDSSSPLENSCERT